MSTQVNGMRDLIESTEQLKNITSKRAKENLQKVLSEDVAKNADQDEPADEDILGDKSSKKMSGGKTDDADDEFDKFDDDEFDEDEFEDLDSEEDDEFDEDEFEDLDSEEDDEFDEDEFDESDFEEDDEFDEDELEDLDSEEDDEFDEDEFDESDFEEDDDSLDSKTIKENRKTIDMRKANKKQLMEAFNRMGEDDELEVVESDDLRLEQDDEFDDLDDDEFEDDNLEDDEFDDLDDFEDDSLEDVDFEDNDINENEAYHDIFDEGELTITHDDDEELNEVGMDHAQQRKEILHRDSDKTYRRSQQRPAKKLKTENAKLKREFRKTLSENRKLKRALNKANKNMNEAFKLVNDSFYVQKLMVEHTTTDKERIDIMKRFDRCKNRKESKALYESIKSELKEREDIDNLLKETFEGNNNKSTSSATSPEIRKIHLNEQTAYQKNNKGGGLDRMKQLMTYESPKD